VTRLSICIATLNRADFIEETLRSVLRQISEDIEVVVIDGASSDGTDCVVQELFEGRSNCRLIRLPEKGGVDKDYCRAVDGATGEFCWLMTDDDILMEGAIARVLSNLQDDVDLVLVNSEVATKDLATTLVPRRLNIAHDREFGREQHDQLLAATGDMLSFIGSVVMRRSAWLARDHEPYLGTEFIHVGVIFQRPLERATRLIAQPLVRIRYGNAQWSRRAFDIWMRKWPRLIWSFPHLSDAAKRQVVARDPRLSLWDLLSMKIRGCYGRAEYRRELHDAPLGIAKRAAAMLLAWTPEVPFNAAMYWASALVPCFPTLRQELRSSPFWYKRRRGEETT
jgi:glycosyltransferase involved in cell wall biosynthesis